MSRRLDGADLAELAHHAIAKLVTEGFVPVEIDQHAETAVVGKRVMPVAVVLNVRFVPERP
jgi:hypothetical protein